MFVSAVSGSFMSYTGGASMVTALAGNISSSCMLADASKASAVINTVGVYVCSNALSGSPTFTALSPQVPTPGNGSCHSYSYDPVAGCTYIIYCSTASPYCQRWDSITNTWTTISSITSAPKWIHSADNGSQMILAYIDGSMMHSVNQGTTWTSVALPTGATGCKGFNISRNGTYCLANFTGQAGTYLSNISTVLT